MRRYRVVIDERLDEPKHALKAIQDEQARLRKAKRKRKGK